MQPQHWAVYFQGRNKGRRYQGEPCQRSWKGVNGTSYQETRQLGRQSKHRVYSWEARAPAERGLPLLQSTFGRLYYACLVRGLATGHLPRVQEIKHTERLWQGLGQPLCEIHNVVVQVSAVGVEHLVLFMCCSDHERVAVSNWKKATSITQLTLLN